MRVAHHPAISNICKLHVLGIILPWAAQNQNRGYIPSQAPTTIWGFISPAEGKTSSLLVIVTPTLWHFAPCLGFGQPWRQDNPVPSPVVIGGCYIHTHTHLLCKSRLWSYQEWDKQKSPWERGRGKKQPTHQVPQEKGTLGRLGCVINERMLTLSSVFPAGS